MYQKGWKKPLNERNVRDVETMFQEATSYILSLKEPATKRQVVETNRKTGFLGFLICMQSMIALHNFLVVERQLLKYVPGHKICQDHLELFFGLIRSHGGHNDNPTTQQFRSAFKKVVVQNQLSDASTGNCLPLENIAVLSCSSAAPASGAEVLNATTQRKRLLDDESIEQSGAPFSDHNYTINVDHITEWGARTITHVAGYVAFKLEDKLSCEECTAALFSAEPSAAAYLFKRRKSRGGLRYPSESAIAICKKCESLVRLALHTKQLASKTFLADLLHQALRSFMHRKLFPELHDHMCDSSPLENPLCAPCAKCRRAIPEHPPVLC
ncbi:hypothetical protein HPB48_008395 [Haemaphysalis longicornis]|uniref:Transposable element n=1 Tax=Haemaphysalis longicornis TaxID=44386 RepID=A0A9J6H1P4_HAELO|nr:hypothetical protein HPB48_008395 [Haemaphysalis longicornis]